MKLVNRLLLAFSFLYAGLTFADFRHDGKLVLTYPTGQSTEHDLVLSYTSEGFDHKFQVGKHTFNVSGKPESYSIAMLLQPNNLVWVQEFAKGQFETFTLDIGDYKFKLVKLSLKNNT